MNDNECSNAYKLTVDEAASIVEIAKISLCEKSEEYRDLLISLDGVFGDIDSDAPCPPHAARCAIEAAALGRLAGIISELNDNNLSELHIAINEAFENDEIIEKVSLGTEQKRGNNSSITYSDASDCLQSAAEALSGIAEYYFKESNNLEELIMDGTINDSEQSSNQIERNALEAMALVNIYEAIKTINDTELVSLINQLINADMSGAKIERFNISLSF